MGPLRAERMRAAGIGRLLALAFLLGTGAAPLCAAPAAAGAGAALHADSAVPAPRNVLLITVDTLRADHLSAYGYPYDTTPTLRSLAADGVLFEDATVQIPVTGPSHCTIHTSLFPQTHGAYRNGVKMNAEAVTLAEILKGRGFRTVAFVSSWTLRM